MEEVSRTQNRNPYQPGVLTGSLVVTPMVREIVDNVGSRLFSQLSGRPVFRIAGMTSSNDTGSLPAMLDGKPDTFFYCKEIQKAGDWFGVNLGGTNEVRRIRIVQGRKDGDHDRVFTGVVEISADGEKWTAVEGPGVLPETIDLALDPPRDARMIRLRVTKPGKADGTKDDVWTAIREFAVNTENAASLRTDEQAFAALPVRLDDGVFSISPMFEVHPFRSGKMLGLLFPAPVTVERVELDMSVADPTAQWTMEGNTGGNAWQALDAKAEGTKLVAQPGRELRAVRIRNTVGKTLEVKLAKFEVKTTGKSSAASAAVLTDGQPSTHVTLEGTTAVTVPVEKSATEAYLLLGEGASAGIKVTAGDTGALGIFQGPLVRIPLPAGASTLTITSADPTAKVAVHEAIFRTR